MVEHEMSSRHLRVIAPSAADGLSAAEICEAVVRSAASRSWEAVPQG
ncbi:hypothetical protein [Brachybacterium avium]|nr:hypothetical protein [Brachybacterium avium]